MYLTATEKLLKKKFGITSFKEVIQKLENESEETFKDNLFVEKSFFIEQIKNYNKKVNELSEGYCCALEMRKPGSMLETYARNNIGYIRLEYAKQRKLLVHHLSFFYKLKK